MPLWFPIFFSIFEAYFGGIMIPMVETIRHGMPFFFFNTSQQLWEMQELTKVVRNKGTNLSPQEKQQIKDRTHGNGMKLVKRCLVLNDVGCCIAVSS